jgi:predicted outer membrane repeat protein
MFVTSWSLFTWISEIINGNSASKPNRRCGYSYNPWCELLEDRYAPAVFSVSVLTDSTLVGGVLGPAPVGSLRAAVNGLVAPGNTDANNRIVFDKNMTGTLNLVQSLPEITKSVQIFEGLSPGGITIRANGFRIFTFGNLPAAGSVLISGFTFTNGGAAPADNGVGGAILASSFSALTLDWCKFVNNTSGSDGGALFTTSVRNVDISDCQFSNNVSGGSGGAILAQNGGLLTYNLTISNTNFNGNEAANDGGAISCSLDGLLTVLGGSFSDNAAFSGDGGAIRVGGIVLGSSSVLIIGTEFDENTANRNGGAIANPTGMVIGAIEDCTMTGNTAGNQGGAIFDPQRRFLEANNTTAQNSAEEGGGAYVAADADGDGSFVNDIIAENTATADGPDVYGDADSDGNNLIGDADGSTSWLASDLLGTSASPIDPKLNALGFYGGLVETMTLQSGSPALRAGNVSYVSTTVDERGDPRIVDGDVDIGAVEMQGDEADISNTTLSISENPSIIMATTLP